MEITCNLVLFEQILFSWLGLKLIYLVRYEVILQASSVAMRSSSNVSSTKMASDRQNNEHIRENRTKNRTNIRQNRILQKNPNIFLFILLEFYRIIRSNIFIFILSNQITFVFVDVL